MKKWSLDIDFGPKYLFSSGLLLIMAGVLEQLIRPQSRVMHQDMKAMELEAAKEILAEVFKVRLSEVDEMIQNRFEEVHSQEACSGEDVLWPQEFSL